MVLDLEPGTEYFFKTQAVNSAGVSMFVSRVYQSDWLDLGTSLTSDYFAPTPQNGQTH